MPPLVLAGHAYVGSPAIGAGGIGFGTVFLMQPDGTEAWD